MPFLPNFYQQRDRSTNVELIKNLRAARNQPVGQALPAASLTFDVKLLRM